MTEVSSPTIEQDIAQLERLLEQKKAALGHEKSEKEVIHGVVGEKIQRHMPQYSPALPAAPSQGMAASPSYLDQELKDKVQAIVKTVFDKNIEEGIKEAVKSGNISLIDAFHDILVDELYDQLVERKKIEKVE